MFDYSLTGLVTLLTVLVYIKTAFDVGGARARHSTPAPAMSGPEELNRYIRVQANTLETMMIFFPALWLFALTISDIYAAAIGLLYPVSRVFYARRYQAGENRGRAFTVGFMATNVLIAGALVGLAHAAYAVYS